MAIKSETITIKVEPKEKEIIKKLAQEKDQTVSKFMYNTLVQYILKEAAANV